MVDKKPFGYLIDSNDVIFKDFIDAGKEGEVYSGLFKDIEVVIKKYKRQDSNYAKEISAYEVLEHKSMAKYFGYFIDEHNIYNLILEKALGFNLQDIIIDRPDYLTFEDKIEALCQLCDFLTYLRTLHVIHRDLKPDNINIYKDKDNNITLKILDFGITKFSNNTFTFTSNVNNFSVHYSSPEHYNTDDSQKTILSYKTDIWALGGIISFMFSGCTPWTNKCKNILKVQTYLIMNKKFPIPEECEEKVKPLIEICTSIKPENRPNTNVIKALLHKLISKQSIVEDIENLKEADFI